MTIPSAFDCTTDRHNLSSPSSRSWGSHKSINKSVGQSAGNYVSLLLKHAGAAKQTDAAKQNH